MRERGPATKGSVFRLTCDYKPFYPMIPFADEDDATKVGTGFLLHLPFATTPLVVTNHHVVSNAERVVARSNHFKDGESKTLHILGYNPHIDIAILQPDAAMSRLPCFRGMPVSELPQNAEVVAIGYGGGTLRVHETKGIVSGRNEWPHNRIQTDTTINSGNSGGPVVDALSGRVVGVTTSSEDDMESTNFFVGFEEVVLVCARMLHTRSATNTVAIDLGYRLNALVVPVTRAACFGRDGGALVAGTTGDDVGLRKDDVVLKVDVPPAPTVELDASMRVKSDPIWRFDRIDFRTVLDRIQRCEGSTSVDMVVRRDGTDVRVSVTVGPDRFASRPLVPDCELVRYVAFGGLIVQTLSVSHLPYLSSVAVDTPEMALRSVVVVTHVAAGSPFTQSATSSLVGRLVSRLYGEDEEPHAVATLRDVVEFVSRRPPLVVEFRCGGRVGTTSRALEKFETGLARRCLARGEHAVGRGVLRQRTSR